MKLIVKEAIQEDVGRIIARVPMPVMQELQLTAGDIIEIIGRNTALAAVRRAHPTQDENVIRIDGIVRSNAQVSIGDEIEIRKIEPTLAESISLAPLENVQFSDDPSEYFHQKLLDKPLMKGQKIVIEVMGTSLHYLVTKTAPAKAVIVGENTKVRVEEKVTKEETLRVPQVTYEDIGGLKREIELIREMVELPIKHPEVFSRLGIGAPKGVLLTGPPGTGKTLLAKAVASETESQFFSIAGPEIMSKFYGESEKQLRDIFEEAAQNAPAIIFIDEVDSIAPKRGEGHDQTDKRVVAQLLTSMDGLQTRGNVVVIAATNRPDDLDEALRRPGRFDREIRINAPDTEGRKEILQIHSRGMPLAEDVNLDVLAQKTIGYTGADLEVLCKEAALKALGPYVKSLKSIKEKVPTNVLEKIFVRHEHFLDAYRMVEPSALREVLFTKPTTTWNDVGGLAEVKAKLREAVEWPLKDPQSFEKFGIKPLKGILLSGPPGVGKTLIAKAIANEAEANFIAVKGPELISKWVGESEKHIREIFKKARQVAPAIIFFDEFDAISKIRGMSLSDSTERMVNQLLTEIDGIEELEKVMVIAATNRPELIDSALLRPGRIELQLELSLPNEEARLEILKVHTKQMPLDKVDLKTWASDTANWSGAELEAFCREAGMEAMRQHKAGKNKSAKVTHEHFIHAFQEMRARKKEETTEAPRNSAEA